MLLCSKGETPNTDDVLRLNFPSGPGGSFLLVQISLKVQPSLREQVSTPVFVSTSGLTEVWQDDSQQTLTAAEQAYFFHCSLTAAAGNHPSHPGTIRGQEMPRCQSCHKMGGHCPLTLHSSHLSSGGNVVTQETT